jgi:hypothetical protein
MEIETLQPGSILYVCAPTDPKTGLVNVKVGMVLDLDESEQPYRILWTEFMLSEPEAKAFLQLLVRDESVPVQELATVNPYQFMNAYISREDDSIRNGHFELERLPLDKLQLLPIWKEDVQAMQDAMDGLMDANDQLDHTLNRPRWTQVQGSADIEQAVKNVQKARKHFVQFWNNRTPFVKDEAFDEFVHTGFFKHPVTLRY